MICSCMPFYCICKEGWLGSENHEWIFLICFTHRGHKLFKRQPNSKPGNLEKIKKKKKEKYWSLQTFVRITTQLSHTIRAVGVRLRTTVEAAFQDNFLYFPRFCQKCTDRKLSKEIFFPFLFVEDVLPGIELGPFVSEGQHTTY